MIFQEHVAQLLGMHRITDNYRDNVAAVTDDWQAQRLETRFQNSGLQLMLLANSLIRIQNPDRGCCAACYH